jgi:hypothetical protein
VKDVGDRIEEPALWTWELERQFEKRRDRGCRRPAEAQRKLGAEPVGAEELDEGN